MCDRDLSYEDKIEGRKGKHVLKTITLFSAAADYWKYPPQFFFVFFLNLKQACCLSVSECILKYRGGGLSPVSL